MERNSCAALAISCCCCIREGIFCKKRGKTDDCVRGEKSNLASWGEN